MPANGGPAEPRLLPNGKTREKWSPTEDAILTKLVQENGACNWAGIAAHIKHRTAKSCRLRWLNQLDPARNTVAFTEKEDLIILREHRKYGNQWAKIARSLDGRTDNAVKNHFNSTLKRRYGHLMDKTGNVVLALPEDLVAATAVLAAADAGHGGDFGARGGAAASSQGIPPPPSVPKRGRSASLEAMTTPSPGVLARKLASSSIRGTPPLSSGSSPPASLPPLPTGGAAGHGPFSGVGAGAAAAGLGALGQGFVPHAADVDASGLEEMDVGNLFKAGGAGGALPGGGAAGGSGVQSISELLLRAKSSATDEQLFDLLSANGGAGTTEHSSPWSPEEDRILVAAVCENGTWWEAIAAHLPGRTPLQCSQRWARLAVRSLSQNGPGGSASAAGGVGVLSFQPSTSAAPVSSDLGPAELSATLTGDLLGMPLLHVSPPPGAGVLLGAEAGGAGAGPASAAAAASDPLAGFADDDLFPRLDSVGDLLGSIDEFDGPDFDGIAMRPRSGAVWDRRNRAESWEKRMGRGNSNELEGDRGEGASPTMRRRGSSGAWDSFRRLAASLVPGGAGAAAAAADAPLPDLGSEQPPGADVIASLVGDGRPRGCSADAMPGGASTPPLERAAS